MKEKEAITAMWKMTERSKELHNYRIYNAVDEMKKKVYAVTGKHTKYGWPEGEITTREFLEIAKECLGDKTEMFKDLLREIILEDLIHL